MIRVKHPSEKCNKMQEEMIANAPANEKDFHALLFSYGNASYIYHNNAQQFIPTINDYKEWLSGLEPVIKKEMETRGFHECGGIFSFTRYVNEKNDIGMDEYVKRLMGEQDFTAYKKIVDNLK